MTKVVSTLFLFELNEIRCDNINFVYLMFYFYLRLVKDFDRELKDEETRNSPEVNKQLNDEKQSMVS